jgi:tetratricopeptide (TPR) repeat protein
LAEGNRREKRTDRKGRGRPDRRGFSSDRHDPEANAFRVRSELTPLEKAFSQKDFAKQKASLEEILRQLKPLRLRSIDQLDFNTRGRLITSLLRVGRQTAPPAPVAAAAADKPAAADAAASEESPAPEPAVAPEEAPVISDAAAQEQAPVTSDAAAPEQAPVLPPPEAEAEVQVASEATPGPTAFADMMFTLGLIWRAVGDQRRAELAFAASGKKMDQEPAAAASTAPAAPAVEEGKDLKGALRRAVAAKDWDGARRIIKQIPADESRAILEKAGAYELLMERYVETSDFQNVARLYERARQFDQAALAWERAGKLGNARKAYERAKDAAGAQRIRQLEVEELVKRGDRLGAAVLLLAENRREEAVRLLLALPSPKAFRFLQKVKLDDEAMALARREIQQAESENKPVAKARWLEWSGDALGAAEAWEKAERKDKALEMYEQVGQWQKAAQLAEALGRKDQARELYHRAGDRDSAARLEVSTPTQAEEPRPTSAE